MSYPIRSIINHCQDDELSMAEKSKAFYKDLYFGLGLVIIYGALSSLNEWLLSSFSFTEGSNLLPLSTRRHYSSHSSSQLITPYPGVDGLTDI
jgi:hypothetical protein